MHVFNSFRISCSLSLKFSSKKPKFKNCNLESWYTTFQTWLKISCVTFFSISTIKYEVG
jgi:hypothetical protein